jgi:hypothetical protein
MYQYLCFMLFLVLMNGSYFVAVQWEGNTGENRQGMQDADAKLETKQQENKGTLHPLAVLTRIPFPLDCHEVGSIYKDQE